MTDLIRPVYSHVPFCKSVALLCVFHSYSRAHEITPNGKKPVCVCVRACLCMCVDVHTPASWASRAAISSNCSASLPSIPAHTIHTRAREPTYMHVANTQSTLKYGRACVRVQLCVYLSLAPLGASAREFSETYCFFAARGSPHPPRNCMHVREPQVSHVPLHTRIQATTMYTCVCAGVCTSSQRLTRGQRRAMGPFFLRKVHSMHRLCPLLCPNQTAYTHKRHQIYRRSNNYTHAHTLKIVVNFSLGLISFFFLRVFPAIRTHPHTHARTQTHTHVHESQNVSEFSSNKAIVASQTICTHQDIVTSVAPVLPTALDHL